MFGERWDVFTKRVLVENTFMVSYIKIQGDKASLAPFTDAHGRGL